MAKKRTTKKAPAKKRTYTEAPAVIDRGVKCPHCAEENFKWEGRVLNTYPNGNRRIKCDHCGRPFIVRNLKGR